MATLKTCEKVPLDDICTCSEVICRCAEDFADQVDDEWTYHYCGDAWEAVSEFRKYATVKEWNGMVEQWRKDAGV